MDKYVLKGWSSFPSDHAVLFFAIAAGLFFISKRIGLFALTYSILIISLPRVYLGLHYPTDILAGGIIGIGIGGLATKYFTESGYCSSIISFSEAKPQFFYPLFFILSYQIVQMFVAVRHLFIKLYYLIMII
ncbi:MAG: phosphatase PAP2 family protein [Nitrospinales bacterium]